MLKLRQDWGNDFSNVDSAFENTSITACWRIIFIYRRFFKRNTNFVENSCLRVTEKSKKHMSDLKKFSKTEHIVFIKKILRADRVCQTHQLSGPRNFKNVSLTNESGRSWISGQNFIKIIISEFYILISCKIKPKYIRAPCSCLFHHWWSLWRKLYDINYIKFSICLNIRNQQVRWDAKYLALMTSWLR